MKTLNHQTRKLRGQAVARFPALVALTALGYVAVYQATTAAEVTIDEIQSNWRRREENIPSLKLEWRASRFTRKGDFDGSPFLDGNSPQPAEDIEENFSRSLLYDRKRIQFADDGKYFGRTTSGRQDYLATKTTRVWNQRQSRRLRSQDGRFSTGHISTNLLDAYQDAQFRPPMIACWPLSAPNGIRLESYRVAKSATIDGVELVVLEKKHRITANMVDDAEIWLENKTPFLLLRVITYTGPRRSGELTIEYARVPGEEWLPSGWRQTSFAADAGCRMAAVGIITSHDFAPEIRDTDFTIDFPPGTWIRDESQPGKPIEYIQRKDGSQRIILPEERRRGARYEDLIETELGQAKPRNPPPAPPSNRGMKRAGQHTDNKLSTLNLETSLVGELVRLTGHEPLPFGPLTSQEYNSSLTTDL
jgi:hypothetical protein